GLQSDSSYRFERGVDIDNVDKACVRAAELIAEICGGIIEEGIIDVYPDIVAPKQVKLRYERVSKIIGLNFTAQEIKNLLERLNFVTVSETDEELIVKVPSYRVDIEQEIDLIEEVARLYNYDNIESDFSSNINFGLSKMLPELSCPSERNQIRNYMSSRGFTEILTQNQTDPKSVQTMQIEPVRITNPLGEELSLLRTSLIPSVLKVISHNIRNGTSDLKLFEVGKCFAKNDSPDNFIKGISEYENLIVALTGLESPLQWSSSNRAFDFYDIKGICEDLIGQLNLKNIKFNTLTEHPVVSKNSMSINFKKQQIGIFGELRKNLAKQYDIEQAVFIFVLNLSQVYKLPKSVTQYTPVSHYPAITRDLAFILSSDISAGDVASTVINTGGELLRKAVLFDVYKDEKLGGDRKSLAFGLTFRAQDRTLKETEIENIVKNIIKKVEVEFSAQLRTN
ncbi:MAG: phenylalanine--tRNA ligase subunit beta, partial [Candidatus Kapabacteria bacterium]|nr:phenylalanine--tRNA ligase subunit beta [Candidatus Kapabacteria bacterium]